MRFISYSGARGLGLAVKDEQGLYRGLDQLAPGYPGDLGSVVAAGGDKLRETGTRLLRAPVLDLSAISFLPPIARPPKIICVGLNYADHSAESGFNQPAYPTIFARFPSSLIGHGAPILRPRLSEQLDFEGELAAVIGKGGRCISKAQALDHVAGYALFNDASIRDYQTKSPQWTMGKNFDGTGAFGPEFITADELPPGCRGLRIQTRLNGQVMQSASISDMVFDVPTLIEILSQALTLEAGDVIVTGTPSGVGLARKPPVWMRHGDVCEVEIEQIGILRNTIEDEAVERVAVGNAA